MFIVLLVYLEIYWAYGAAEAEFAEAYSELCQASKMKRSTTFFVKRCIFEVRQGSEYSV